MSLYLVLLSLYDCSFTVLWLNLAFVTDFFLFQGLDLLRWASVLWEEAQQLEVDELQKVQLAVAGSEAEGLYRLLRGAVSHSSVSFAPPPPKRCHHAPTTTVSKSPHQESEGVEPEASAPAVEGNGLALVVPSSAVSQSLDVAIPAHMTPLCLNVGGIKRVYKWWVEVQQEIVNLPGCYMHKCAQ